MYGVILLELVKLLGPEMLLNIFKILPPTKFTKKRGMLHIFTNSVDNKHVNWSITLSDCN